MRADRLVCVCVLCNTRDQATGVQRPTVHMQADLCMQALWSRHSIVRQHSLQ